MAAALMLTNHPLSLEQPINKTVNQGKQQAKDYLGVKTNAIKENLKEKAEVEIEKNKEKLLNRLKNSFWEGIDRGRAFFVNFFK